MYTDLFMKFLAVSACFYCVHHDIFRCHKRKFFHEAAFNNLRINDQTIHDIQVQIQNAVNSKKSFRHRKTLIG